MPVSLIEWSYTTTDQTGISTFFNPALIEPRRTIKASVLKAVEIREEEVLALFVNTMNMSHKRITQFAQEWRNPFSSKLGFIVESWKRHENSIPWCTRQA
jgi:hypothetical protein